MWRKILITGTLLAFVGGALPAQEPKPKNSPPAELPREPGFVPGNPGPGNAVPGNPGQGGPGQRKGGGPQGERGKGPFTNNPPFGGRGPRGDGPRGEGVPAGPYRGGEPRGPGFVPGGGTRIGDYERLRRDDPEMFNLMSQDELLQQQTLDVSGELRRAPSEQREKLQTQLTELVNKHFEVRQQRRELQLKRMEAELTRLREAIKQRNDSRDAIIKERMTELVGDAKGLGF